jgi:6-phosphogluconate dehydrogenase
MEIGIIGLGRMGSNMAERLLRGGHRVVGYTRNAETVKSIAAKGAVGADSVPSLVKELTPPRAVWLMVSAGTPVDETIHLLEPHLAPGDVIIDGGNSNYKDSMRRAEALKERAIESVDVGTSGGVWGLTEGYCLMIGGDPKVVERLKPIFETLAPQPDRGWAHLGPNGAGHFVKMIHNGIEYGLMQAYAEGFALMRRKPEFALDIHQVAEIWRYGSVIRSWLLDLIARGLAENPELHGIKPYVEDSGAGRWTAFEAVDMNVSTPVLMLSLLQRFRSRDEEGFADKLLAMMRHQFGGHEFKKEE